MLARLHLSLNTFVFSAGPLAATLLLCLSPVSGRAQVYFTGTAPVKLAMVYNHPYGVAVDAAGDIFVADAGLNQIEEIVAVNGSVPAIPTIRVLAGDFLRPTGVAVDAAGDVFVADAYHTVIKEIVAVNGGIPTNPTILSLGSGFYRPFGLAVDRAGDVFVADAQNNVFDDHGSVKEMVAVNGSVPTNPMILTLGSNFVAPAGLAVDFAGNVFVADEGNNSVDEIVAVDGVIPASPTILTLSRGFNSPIGVAVDKAGDVFVANNEGFTVQEILAVDGSIPATNPAVLSLAGIWYAAFDQPSGLAVDSSGNVFVSGGEALREVSVAPKVNFGSVVVCPQCSETVTLSYGVAAGTTIGSVNVVNADPANQDFKAHAGGTTLCKSQTYKGETACSLNVTFTPTAQGLRQGMVQFLDASGNLLGSTLIYGTGAIAATDLQFNGSATSTGGLLQLSDGGQYEAGSAFHDAPLNVQKFTTSFTFQLTEVAGKPYGDGITFTIQNSGPTALGGVGGSLGYKGISKSMAIKFDSHNDAGEGARSTGLYVDGVAPTVPAVSLEGTDIDLHSGHIFAATLTYNGTVLELSLVDTMTNAAWSERFGVDIPTVVGGNEAYIGFTGGTGELSSVQQILSWTFTNP